MLKAVIFDMDDTLLSINLSAFMAVLVRDESSLIAQIGRRSPFSVLAAYSHALLVLNQAGRGDERTNRELFDAIIRERTGVDLADPVVGEAIDYFERAVLPKKNDCIIAAKPMPGALEALDEIRSRGLRCALFTNPSFSRSCIGCRMGWAGITDEPFELVTVMENSRHCKPDAAYYLEGLKTMGLDPSEVLMVGNDPRRDFPSPDCGLQTAYVGSGSPVRATWCGSMANFAKSFDEIQERFCERQEKRLLDLVQDTSR